MKMSFFDERAMLWNLGETLWKRRVVGTLFFLMRKQHKRRGWVGRRISLFLEEEKACLVHLETANGAFPFPVLLLNLSF